MKAITKTSEEIFDKMLEERTKGLNEKLDEIANKISSKPREEKVEDIIKKMKERIPERIIRPNPEPIKQEPEPIKQQPDPIKEVKQEIKEPSKPPEPPHENVLCPNCTKGHIHKLESSGLKMKCSDGSCGEEYFMIPKDADSTCVGCGMPLKQSIFESKNLDHCPFCHGNKAIPFSNGKPVIKFDFSKMKQ